MLSLQAWAILAVSRVARVPGAWHPIGRALEVPAAVQLYGHVPLCVDDTGRFLYSHLQRWDTRTGVGRAYDTYVAPDADKNCLDYWLCWRDEAPPLQDMKPYHGRFNWRAEGFDYWMYCRGDALGLYIALSAINGEPQTFFSGKIGGSMWPGKGPLPSWMLSRITQILPVPGVPSTRREPRGYTIKGPTRQVRIDEPCMTVGSSNDATRVVVIPKLLPGGIYWSRRQAYLYQAGASLPEGIYLLDFARKRPRMEKVSRPPDSDTRYYALSDGSLVQVLFKKEDGPSRWTTRIYNPSAKTWKSFPGVWVRANSLNGRFVAYSVYPWT